MIISSCETPYIYSMIEHSPLNFTPMTNVHKRALISMLMMGFMTQFMFYASFMLISSTVLTDLTTVHIVLEHTSFRYKASIR